MVYLLKFSHYVGTPRHNAQYYLGCCKDNRLEERIHEHRIGNGAKITRAAAFSGYTIDVVRIWPGKGFAFEKTLKSTHNYSKLDTGGVI